MSASLRDGEYHVASAIIVPVIYILLLYLSLVAPIVPIKDTKLLFFMWHVCLPPVTWKRTGVKCESLIIIATLDLTPFPLTISAPSFTVCFAIPMGSTDRFVKWQKTGRAF